MLKMKDWNNAHAPIGERSENQSVYSLISVLKTASAPLEKIQAVQALGRLGDPRAIRSLVESLRDGHAEVRRHSAVALGRLQSIRSIDALVERLEDPHEEPRTRAYAAEALGSIRSVRVVPVLQRHLADDDAYIRDAVAGALERILKR